MDISLKDLIIDSINTILVMTPNWEWYASIMIPVMTSF